VPRVPQQRFNALHAPAVEQHVRALAVGALKEAAQVGGGQSPFASPAPDLRSSGRCRASSLRL